MTTDSTPEQAESRPRPTREELLGSLTGYDEIALEDVFGKSIDVLVSGSNTMLFRGLIFIELRRQGVKDAEARKTALATTAEEALDRFAEDEDEPTPDTPITESGKESSSLD